MTLSVNGTGKKPLLSLETVVPERECIAIDGQRYELAAQDDFGLADLTAFNRLSALGASVTAKTVEALTEEDIAAAAEALRLMVRMIVRDAPEAVLAKLSDNQRMQIVQLFTTAGPVPPPAPPSPPTSG